ncbi:MAG TPA: hypothetical protein VMR16_03370, partial [Candidatus Saccharimonadales bacterium]|nr:hypothetical protein [Candidatus Saccharimonadales bacterium]
EEVIHGLHIDGGQLMQLARDNAEANGISFSVFDYIKQHHPNIDINIIESIYRERARAISDSLVEVGASELIKFLRSTGREFCIMSYGDKRWQTLKIMGAGFDDVPKLIVPSQQKSLYIKQWRNIKSGGFIVPKACFLDNKPREAREIILVDDKASAFEGMPIGARGYLVQKQSSMKLPQQSELPPNVQSVSRIDEIIDLE